MPFTVGQRGAIDNDIVIVETAISIHDRGRWVGNIDALSLYKKLLDLSGQPLFLLFSVRPHDNRRISDNHYGYANELIRKYCQSVAPSFVLNHYSVGVLSAGWLLRVRVPRSLTRRLEN